MKNWNPAEYLIFETVTGSHLYGTSTPDSDVDLRGICIPPREVMLNPFQGFEQKDSGFEEEDRVIYGLEKFVKLCADANPNIIELLFAPKDSWKFIDLRGKTLLRNYTLFLSKKIKHTFTGYAFSQLNDIKRHRQWFLDPPKQKPSRKEYGLGETPIVSGDSLSALSNRLDLLKEDVRDEIKRELSYREAKIRWDNYWSWKVNRNPKRMQMEEKFGYDTKHAMHLVRLMIEGKNLLLDGYLEFPLEDSAWLIAIRNGEYTYEQILDLATNMEADFDLWYEKSFLPNGPDREAISEMYLYLTKE